MKVIIKFLTIGIIVMLLPSVAIAQTDGGGKKKKKPIQTEQATPVKKPARSTTGTINGHEWVDLGLPSGTKWATCNVGASSPEGYGDYFAWGETSPKSEYTEADSRTSEVDIADISGNPSYDAARANWGGSWRMPTKAECQELVDKCKWTWTTQGGKNGYKVIGKNDNSIFLPAAGYHGTSLEIADWCGNYWSSSPYGDFTKSAYDMRFIDSKHYVDWYYRRFGLSVRAVSE